MDFIRRVNPKDINKLQLEGLVKSGAFDNLEKNRRAIFETIQKLIQLNKIYQFNKFYHPTPALSGLSLRCSDTWLI